MLKHGEYVAPHIVALELENSPPNDVNPNTLNGVVARFDKRIPVRVFPSAFNGLGGVYRNAMYIRSGGGSTQLRGLILWFSFITIAPFVVFHREIIELHISIISSGD